MTWFTHLLRHCPLPEQTGVPSGWRESRCSAQGTWWFQTLAFSTQGSTYAPLTNRGPAFAGLLRDVLLSKVSPDLKPGSQECAGLLFLESGQEARGVWPVRCGQVWVASVICHLPGEKKRKPIICFAHVLMRSSALTHPRAILIPINISFYLPVKSETSGTKYL